MPTAVPVRKVMAGGVAGAATTLVVYLLNHSILKSDPIPAEVATAITTLLTFMVSYLIPPAASEAVG
jgi:H+/Cl- antiporter ClcA